MQRRLVKTIRATQITSADFAGTETTLTSREKEALSAISERVHPEIRLRRAGLSPAEIERLRFLKWSLARPK